MSARRPSVLCIIDTLGAGGGAEQLIATLAPVIREQGTDIEVVALHDWPDDLGAGMAERGVPLHRLHARAGATVATAARLREVVRARPYDIVWGHLYAGNMQARLAQWSGRGAKSIVTLHSEGYLEAAPRRLKDRLAVAIEGRVLGGADARVAVSGAVAADWSGYFGWSDVTVAYNGVDIAAARRVAAGTARAAARRDAGCEEGDFLIVSPARYVTKKGQRYLLDAALKLRAQGVPVRLFLCGTGPLKDELAASEAALALGNRLTVSGVIAQERLFPLIAAADAFVLPSLREPFGIAGAEAMAIGTPTVLTDVDGFRELVGTSGAAKLVPPADADALAEALAAIQADPFAAQRMARAGADHVARTFSIESCAARWNAIFAAVHRGESIRCAG